MRLATHTQSASPTDRAHAIDLLRAATVADIIGRRYFPGQVDSAKAHVNPATENSTNVILGSLTCLSGDGLGACKGAVDAQGLARFFRCRLLRDHTVYALAIPGMGEVTVRPTGSAPPSAPGGRSRRSR